VEISESSKYGFYAFTPCSANVNSRNVDPQQSITSQASLSTKNFSFFDSP